MAPKPLVALMLALSMAGAPACAGAPPDAADASPFAALTVTPAGRQVYDLSTGITRLPDGGTVVDQDTGVRLDATSIDYVAGDFIQAQGATVEGSFGRIEAAAVHVDITSGVLSVDGTLRLERNGLTLTAGGLQYDANRQIAEFNGPVDADRPAFHARRLLLDARSGDVLLVGPYTYREGPIAVTSPRTGGRLQLTFHDVEGQAVYDAATQVSQELLERFSGRLH